MNYLLYNPLSNSGKGDDGKKKAVKELSGQFPDLEEVDYTSTIFVISSVCLCSICSKDRFASYIY